MSSKVHRNHMDITLHEKVHKAKERISENMHYLANEPSLAYFRVQENTRKSLPHMIDKKIEAEKLHHSLQGSIYDLEYAIQEITNISKTEYRFKHIIELSKNALFVTQQIKYLESKRVKSRPNSVYKRLSAHITMDIPDIPDALKETANKVELLMNGNNSRHSALY